MFEARRGARKVASPSSNPTNAKQAVTPTASRRAGGRAARQAPATDAEAASLDIGRQRDEPHPHVAQRIHEGIVAWIDHHVGLRADAEGKYVQVKVDAHRHQLRGANPAALAARAGQAGPRVDAAVADPVAERRDAPLDDASWKEIGRAACRERGWQYV